MRTVWVLGNSFSYQIEEHNTWMKQVADQTNSSPQYLSINGTSLDFVYQSFHNIKNDIKSNDIVLATFTDINRRWFFKDVPSDAIFSKLDPDALTTIVEKEELRFEKRDPNITDAINLYLDHLDNMMAFETYMLNFLYHLNNFAAKKNIHVIILPCFEYVSNKLNEVKDRFQFLHIADKSIMSISKNEFLPDEFYLSGIMRHNPDIRQNHLTKSNHDAMAEKLMNNIIKKEPISFRHGFNTNFLDREKMRDQQFSDKELFQTNLEEFYQKYADHWVHITHTVPEHHAFVVLPR